MQIRITPNDMRAELAKSVARMREMRKGALAGGTVQDEVRRAFRLEIACAMSYVEAVENPLIANSHVDKLIACTTAEKAFLQYDSTQDRLWKCDGYGKEFLGSLRLLTLHYMHAGAESMDDAFFMFQVTKCRFEQDASARTADDFLQPAYGGIWLSRDNDYLGRIIRNLSGDKTVQAIDGDCRFVLRLDWWPDDGPNAVGQLARVAESAGRIGYTRVEFIMPQEHSYEELNAAYGTAISARSEMKRGKQVWIGSIATGRQDAAAPPDIVLANAEIAETPVSALNNGSLVKLPASAYVENDGIAVAAGMGTLGFVDRLLLSLETERARVNVGIYLRAIKDTGGFAVDSLVKDALEIGRGDALNPDSWEKAIVEHVKRTGHNLCYAVLRNKNTGAEMNLEDANEEPKWNDI